MRDRLRILVITIREFGGRTTYHGLLHIFRSEGRAREAFWLLLLLVGLIVGVFHTVQTVRKFTENSVTSQLKLMNEEAVFPDITICNRNPASVGVTGDTQLPAYLDRQWDSWFGWFKEEKEKRADESFSDYRERSRRICRRLLQVLWVSADTRDISHMDKNMLLHCRYNGVPCTHKNFSLVQTNRFWNCYTFHPDPRNSASGSGDRGAELDMVLFTDSFRQNHGFSRIMRSAAPDGYQFEFKNSTTYCVYKLIVEMGAINQALALDDDEFQSRGVRVLIHEKRKYPLHSTEFVDVTSGSSAKIGLRPIVNRLLPTSHRRCSQPPHEEARYVVHFAHASQQVVTKRFTKAVADFVTEAKQKIIHEKCGCFSHQYPFQVNTSQLCYFAPPEHWKTPSDAVLRNIKCHDDWFKQAEVRSMKLKKQFRHRRWCSYTRHRPWHQKSKWPPLETLPEIWDDLILPQINDGVEFLPGDGHSHHIMNVSVSTDDIYSEQRKSANVTRELMVLLLDVMSYSGHQCDNASTKEFANCHFRSCNSAALRSTLNKLRRCLSPEAIVQNLAAVRVGLESPAADAYEEETGFHWTEALSEIGGTMGLWLGVSLLSACELLELLYVLAVSCIRGPQLSEQSEAPTEPG